MKERTKAILVAMEKLNPLSEHIGRPTAYACVAIGDNGTWRARSWFTDLFAPTAQDAPIDGDSTRWLGCVSPANYKLRLTFLAMAAAVSETEE